MFRAVMMRYDQIHFDGDKELEEAMAKHRGFVALRQEEEHMTAFAPPESAGRCYSM